MQQMTVNSEIGGKLVAVLKKPSDHQELKSIINYFAPDQIAIIIADSKRLTEETVRSWPCIANDNNDLSFQVMDRKNLTKKSFLAAITKFGEIRVIALPVGVCRAYYKSISYLKKKSVIVNISDGTPDGYGIFGYYLAMDIKSLYHCLKGLVTMCERYLSKADLCFYPFHPVKACFAKKTLPCECLDVSESKVKLLKILLGANNQNRILIVGGWGVNPEELAKKNRISSYIATSKDRKICVDGLWHDISEYLCAEEVLEIIKPSAVIGGTSVAVVAAKVKYPDIPCIAIKTGEINKAYGRFFESQYTKLSTRVGLKVVSHKNPNCIGEEISGVSEEVS